MIDSKMERIIVGAMTRRDLSYEKLSKIYEKKVGHKISKQALNQQVKKLSRTNDTKTFRKLLEIIGVNEASIEKFVEEVK